MKKSYLRALSLIFFIFGSAYFLIASLIFFVFGPIETEWFGHKISFTSLINPWKISLACLLVGWIFNQIVRFTDQSKFSQNQERSGKFSGHPFVKKLFISPGKLNRLGLGTKSGHFISRVHWSSALVVCLFLAVLWGYGSHLFHYKSSAVTGCDSYAYLQGSVLMSQKGLWHTEIEDPLVPLIYQNYQHPPSRIEVIFFLSPHGHYVYDLLKGIIYNVFPPGLSWLLLPFIKLGTFHTAFFIIPILSLLSFFLFFYLSAKHINAFFGFSVVAFTFFNLIVFQNTVMIMSDLPSMVFLALSISLLLLNFNKNNRLLPFLAGIGFGFSWTIRYSNIVGLVPILFLFIIKIIKNKSRRDIYFEPIFFLVPVFVFGIIPMALYTQHLFGTFLSLVYEPYTRSRMELGNFLDGTVYYLSSVYENFGLIEVVIVLTGFLTSLFDQKRRLASIVGFLIFISFFFFYSFHSIRHARYLMPVFPSLGLFYAFGVIWIGEWFNRGKAIKIMMLLLLSVYPLVEYVQKPFYPGNFIQEKSSHLLKEQVENNAVIFCDSMSGPIKLYSGLTGYRLCWTNLEVFVETVNILNQLHRPIYFFLDSEDAQKRFEYLMSHEIIKKERLKLISENHGIQLYKLIYLSPII